MHLETIAVHGGFAPDPTTKAVAVPIYQTTSYAFDNTQHGADLFDLKVQGNIYTRIMNPTNDVLEKRCAELEGGIGGLALASGQAAITYSILTITEAGDNIVSTTTLYGGTYNLFAHTFPQLGIQVRFADHRDPAAFAKLIDARTKAVYCETARVVPLRNMGAPLSPFNAFLILQGIETLALRMERICDNTAAVARQLKKHAKVSWVRYAGLEDDADYPLAKKYMRGKASGILTFGVKGGREAGARFIDALKLVTRLVNIGDAKSLACHPATTTHRQLNEQELKAAGVFPDMVRLSLGIEHIDDLRADIDQALAAA